MTSRQRWLAALDRQPIDRLPFWPKIGGNYLPNRTGRFAAATLQEIAEFVDFDPIAAWVPMGIKATFAPGFGAETVKDGQSQRTRYITPSTTLEQISHYDEASTSEHPLTFPIQGRDDLLRMADWYAARRFTVDQKQLATARQQIAAAGETGPSVAGMPTSPLMTYIEFLAGVANAHFLLADYPDEVARLLAEMHRCLCDEMTIMAETNPADILWLSENTSTTLLSPEQYRTYNKPHLMEYAKICQTNNRRLVLHMCGKLNALLPDLADLGAQAFEAFTAPPLGNTTLLEGRSAAPDVCLIGGTHACLWQESPQTIIDHIQASLDPLPHHRGIVITSAGVLPPDCEPETLKEVCDWIKQYPVRN